MIKIATKTLTKMTKQEKEEFDALYEYVRTEIMEYDKRQSLSRVMVLRLKGLKTNKFIENRNIQNTADYSYAVILETFKMCTPVIKQAMKRNLFKDEQHRFNYILKIIEPKINTVYKKMQQEKTAEEKTEHIDTEFVSHMNNHNHIYKKKSRKEIKVADDIW